MPRRVRWLGRPALGAALVIAGALAIHSCGGSSSKSTNPYGGGGGGGVPKELDSGNITAGTTFSHTFNTAGSFPYHCNIHAGMTGTVVVNASNTTTDASLNMSTGNPYATVNLKTGGTVHWNNITTVTHTVTSD